MDEQRTHEFRKARRAACRAERDPADPVAFEFEHEETGEVKFIEAIQVEIGFQEENPRWQLIGPVYAQAPVVAGNPSDQMREALQMYMSAGSGNSTDFDLQARAWSMAHQALNHTPDTGKMVHVNKTPKIEHDSDDVLTKARDVDHIGDANKMARLTEEELINQYILSKAEWKATNKRQRERIAVVFGKAVMDAMIARTGGSND